MNFAFSSVKATATKLALRGLWLEALRFGIERDHPDKVAAFDQTHIEFICYGDINNDFLSPEGHAINADEASRRVTLARLKQYTKNDFLNPNTYDNLPGKSSTREFLADVFSGLCGRIPNGEAAIYLAAPDMKEHWNRNSDFGSKVRYPMIHPLRAAMDRNDGILIIAHSLGTTISYATLWRFSRMGEYRPEYSDKKIDLFVTIGSPLGDDIAKSHLRGTDARGKRCYPANIRQRVNIVAEDDYIAHDESVADDFRDMIDCGLNESIEDHRMYNLAVRHAKSNPHHGAGYLIHPVLADTVVDWL